MKATDFARSINPDHPVQFGLLSRDEIVTKLRSLADRIERNERPKLVLQEAHSCDQAEHGDYLLTTLVLQFAELNAASPKGTKLYGNDQAFPVDASNGVVERADQ